VSAPEGQSAVFRRLAQMVVAHRWLALAVSVAIAAGCGTLAAGLRTEIEVESMLDEDAPELLDLEAYRDTFGRDDLFLILVEGDVFTAPYLERLRALHRAAEDVELAAPDDAGVEPGVGGDARWDDDEWGEGAAGSIFEDVTSMLNIRHTRGDPAHPGGIIIQGLMDPWPDDVAAFEAKVRAAPKLVGRVVDEAGRHSLISLRTGVLDEAASRDVHVRLTALAAEHTAPGFEPVVTGIPSVTAVLNQLIFDEMAQLTGLLMLMLLGVAVFLFRHPVGVVGPVAVVALALMWMYGFMAALDYPLTMLANVLPSFVLCVGIADAIHVQSAYRDARAAGVDNTEAIVSAVGTNGVPILFTTVTTMLGLASFNLATIDAIGEAGTAGAFGVLAALVNTLVVLPAVLSFNTKSLLGAKEGGAPDVLDGFLSLCRSASRMRAGLVAAGLAVVSLGGIALVTVAYDPLSWLASEHPLRTSFAIIDEHLGGTSSVQLFINSTGERTMSDVELLNALAVVETRVEGFDHPDLDVDVIGDIAGVPELIREANEVFAGAYTMTASQAVASNYLELHAMLGRAHFGRFITTDFKKGQTTIRTRWLEANAYGPVTAHVRAVVEAVVGELADVRVTGAAVTVFATVAELIRSLIKSFGTALLVITPVMMLALWDLRLGIIAMVPNLLPIAMVLGVMGYTGMEVDITNVLLSSFAIGLVVDDTIHFLHHFKVRFDLTGDVDASVEASMRHVGRALMSTSAILSIGFSMLMLSEISSTVRFGALLCGTVILAVLSDLIFAPALIRAVYRRNT